MPPISPSDRLLGDLLVARHVLTLEQFDEAVRLAETWQVRLGDAILSRSWSDPQHYYRTIAEHFDLPFVNLLEQPPDPALLRASDADFYAQRLMIPWARQEGRILIATAAVGRRNRRHRCLVAACRSPAPKQALQPQQEDDRHHQPHATNDPGAEPLGDGEP